MFRRLCTIWRLSKLTLAAAILWGGAVPASAQSLRQALISTYENSPTIRTAQAQALQSVEVYNQAVAATKSHLQINRINHNRLIVFTSEIAPPCLAGHEGDNVSGR